MVDFKKRLGKKDLERPIDPLALYESLDRASDKGPLRPSQEVGLTCPEVSARDGLEGSAMRAPRHIPWVICNFRDLPIPLHKSARIDQPL